MEDWERREAERWLEHHRDPIPPRDWILGLLVFLVALVIVDGLTFYGLYLLGALLHKVIFG